MKSYTSFLKNIIYIIFIYLVIFLMSFILASFNFFNHKNKEIKYDDIEIYLLEDISSFQAYILNKDLFMIVEFKNKHTKEYLFNYCEYYTKYNLNIYLEAKMEDEIYFVNLNNEGIFSIV